MFQLIFNSRLCRFILLLSYFSFPSCFSANTYSSFYTSAGGSCKMQCCYGQNPDCRSFNYKTNQWCYCDSYCQRSQDCCYDYARYCQVPAKINCIVSNWSNWSPCSVKCGQGFTQRIRKIIIQPKNNGKLCGNLKEYRSCYGKEICMLDRMSHRRTNNRKIAKKDKIPSLSLVKKETTLLLPDFGGLESVYKKYSQKFDIRHHIYERTLSTSNDESEKFSNYCGIYRITLTLGTCNQWKRLSKLDKAQWSQHYFQLKPGSRICATCYREHLNFYGGKQQSGCGAAEKNMAVTQQNMHWRAERTDNCHGYFVLEKRKENCTCPSGISFLML